jgi:F-type H+-transporting ATPase subunit b
MGIGLNLQLFIVFLINFIILFGVLTFFLYKPIMRVLDERQAKIKESMEQAERIKEQTTHAEDQIKEQLDAARKEGQGIVAQATQIGERLKEEAKEGARQEAETLIAKARSEIEQDREKAIEELRSEFADIAILAAEKVINEKLDKKTHHKIIDEVLDKSSTFKQN